MDKERLRSLVSGLWGCELTYLEEQCVGRAKEYFEENGMLTEQQDLILEAIYQGKIKRMEKRPRQDETHSAQRFI